MKKYYNVKLIVYYGYQIDNEFIDYIKKHKIEVVLLKGLHFSKLIKIFKIFLTSNSKSIVFSYLATTNTINAIIGYLAGIKFRFGGIRNSKLSSWKMILQRLLHNYLLTGTIFNNYSGFLELKRKKFNVKKSHIIHNAIDINQKKIIRTQSKNIKLLSVGRLVEQKDYLTALRGIRLLISNLDKCRYQIEYIIVGYGNLENQILDYINNYKLTNYVNLIINPQNIDYYYKQSDIYISTSIFEGLSNSIMEAMEYSLPVVATDVGDNKCLVQHNTSGYIFDVGDHKTLSKYLEFLIKSHHQRCTFGLRGYVHLKRNFSTKSFTNKYLELINSL